MLLVLTAIVVVLFFYHRYINRQTRVTGVQQLKALEVQNDVHAAFVKLVNEDGAGEWPPNTSHQHWPRPILAYMSVYLEMAPLLSTPDASLDDNVNTKRRQEFRSRMQRTLTQGIDLLAVQRILDNVESGNWVEFPRQAYNGFYSCIAYLRHSYRWAVNPVVTIAQLEKKIDMPIELEMPWVYLNQMYGITSPGGNIMSNIVYNFNRHGHLSYWINGGMSDLILRSEYEFCRLLYDSEVLGAPIYCSLIHATICIDGNDKNKCLSHIEEASTGLRTVLCNFYNKMGNAHIAHSVWMQYVQGFLSWGTEQATDDVCVEYHGLSGSHVLLFMVIDAFLGLNPYLEDEAMERYVSRNLRDFCGAIRTFSIRSRLGTGCDDDKIRNELNKIVQQMRVFRSAHRVRALEYFIVRAPERLPMAAGFSLMNGAEDGTPIGKLLEPLDMMLVKRLQQTM